MAVDDIAALILPHKGDNDWTRWDGRWAPWRPGHQRPPPPPSNVTEFGAYGRDVQIQVRTGSAAAPPITSCFKVYHPHLCTAQAIGA